MKNLKFSIVTVSYNQAKFIEDNIKSIISQNYNNFEHIIVDADSSDGTMQILEKYNHLNWISEPDNGQSDGLNKGFKKANGDIIGWINSDDMLHEGALKKVNEFFNNHPDAIAVVGNYVIIDENNQIIKTIYPTEYTYNFVLNKAKAIAQPSTFFKREVFEKIGYINVKYHYAMDRDFFIRITSIDKIHYINEDLAYFRWQNDSKTMAGPYNFAKELLKIRRSYGGKFFSRGNMDTLYIIVSEPLRRIKWLRNIVRKIKGAELIL